MKPGFFRWWNTAPVVALDVTNPEAVAWFVHRLRSLQQETGIDGFKFDAGVLAVPLRPGCLPLIINCPCLKAVPLLRSGSVCCSTALRSRP